MELEVKQILGIDESVNPEILKSEYLSQLKNMVLDSPGYKYTPKKRGGWTLFNSNSAGNSNIVSLHDVQISSNNYLLATSGTILKKSLDGTDDWENVKTGLTTGLKTNIVVYNDTLICTNGTDAPFVASGSTLGTVNDLEILPPDTQSVTLTVGTGGDLDEAAKYMYVFVYVTATGEKSNISNPVVATTTTDKKITISNIPVSSDGRVISKKIYRTEGGGETLFLLATIGASDVTYVDYAADDLLGFSEIADIITVPLTAKYSLIHKDRLILANITKAAENKIFPPTKIATLTQGTGGNISDGVYKYRYSLVDSEGVESRLSDYKEITISESGDTASVALQIDQPYIGASANRYGDIKFWRVYRTAAGGSTYKLVDDFGVLPLGYPNPFNGTTDTSADASLGADYERATISLPNTIMWADLGKPSNINDLNILPVYPDDGGGITGTLDDKDGFWAVKDNSFIKIFTDGAPENWRPYKVIENLGCDLPESLVKHDQYIYFSRAGKIYRYPDYILVPLSETRKNLFASMTGIKYGTYFKDRSWYVILLEAPASNYIACFDEKINTWYYFTMTEKAQVIEKQFGSNKGKLLKGNGYLVGGAFVAYYDDSATADTETGYTVQISTQARYKTFTMNDGISLARPRILFLDYLGQVGLTFTITITDPRTLQSKTTTVTAGSTETVLKKIIDSMTGTFTEVHRAVYVNIEGQGLNILNGLRLSYNTVRRGYAIT